MKKRGTVLAVSLLLCGAAAAGTTEKMEQEKNKAFTAEVMLQMKRLSGTVLSLDGKQAVYSLSTQDMEQNGSFSNLYRCDVADGRTVALTEGTHKNYDPQWARDGKIYFLSTASGEAQIWSILPDGSGLTQVSDLKGGVNGFRVSPKGDNLWYAATVQVEPFTADRYPDLPKTTARIYDDLMARHWDYWLEGKYSHLFVAPLSGGKMGEGKDIMPGEAWDVPMAPYFDNGEIAWNNAGTAIAYTAKKLKGKEYALSTNSDIYLYTLADGKTVNLTEGMPGYDKYPLFSPDDKRIAWRSMERAGNEADKERLFVIDLQSGEKTYLTPDFDYNATALNWEGNNTIWFIAPIEATHQICRVKAGGKGKVEVVTSGDQDYTSLVLAGDAIVAERTKLTAPTDLFVISRKDGSARQLTAVNADILDQTAMSKVMKRWVTTTDGKRMLTWVVLPPNFDASKKYPTLLYCQGGPQSVVSQFWSYRWNLALIAAQGYVVVAPNRRGLPSFGQEWLDQISGDYSGQNIRDYLSAIDDVAREPWVDRDRLGCVGASYGGYSVFYLAGHHDKRFKAFIAHCGMFDFDSFYGSTEELWFPNNDIGGPYWSDDPTAKRSFAASPHRSVDQWDTPILIITGMKDYRIPYTQSLEAFTAARLRGLDARLVVFEDEAHQVFKPQNALLWHNEFFRWLDRYLK